MSSRVLVDGSRLVMVVTRRTVEMSVAVVYFPGVLQPEGVEAGGGPEPGTV